MENMFKKLIIMDTSEKEDLVVEGKQRAREALHSILH